MDVSFDAEDYPREIVFSSVFLAVLGVMQFLPDGSLGVLPFEEFFQGLFSNAVGFVTFISAILNGSVFNYSGYVFGFLLLTVSVSALFYRKSSRVINFLATATVAVYGFIALLMVFLWFPGRIPDTQILGLGAQVIFMGLAATEIYTKVLDTEAFELEVCKPGYAAAVWQMLFGTAFIGFLQFFVDYLSGSATSLALISVLGILGVMMMYSAYELASNTRRGFYLSYGLLSLLFVAGIQFESLINVLVPFGLMILLWVNRQNYGVEYELPKVREYLP